MKVGLNFNGIFKEYPFVFCSEGIELNNLKKEHANHESLATTITRERIAGIRTLSGTNTTFEVINLSDLNAEQHGVRVVFRIPYQTQF